MGCPLNAPHAAKPLKGVAMKLRKLNKLLLASWLVLSCFNAPFTVFAEGNQIESTTQATLEQPTAPEVDQTTTVANDLSGSTTSGDTLVESNAEVGSVATGDATIVTTVVTTDNAAGLPETDSFSLDPTPDSVGDITLELPNTQSAGAPVIIPLTTNTEEVTNTITIASISGGATLESNGQVAQIYTGDALSNANVINILGSNVSAPEIFLGYVTVDGNLTGDMLLPADLLQSLMSPEQPSVLLNSPLNSNNRYAVASSVDANANSGYLLADSNGSVESARSGNAMNMLNSLDLLGANIYGQTGLLVFVNVAGTWDGSILSQDPGIKAALIGSSGSVATPFIIPLNTTTAVSLANNIKISANSGDINASKNSSVGDMATGNATTVVNIANILGSNLIFTRQLGILFITVLGNWYGSFGFNTPYGDPAPSSAAESVSGSTTTSSPTTSGYVSISRTRSDISVSDVSSSVSVSSFSYPITDNNWPDIPKKNKSLTDYMFWGIPLIGGSIALGLVKTDKKKAKA